MKKIILIGLLVIIVLISGCAEKECKNSEDCLSKTCYTTKCKNNECVYISISDCCGNEICEVGETYPECAVDCPNCDDNSECTTDSFDYHEQECVNAAIPNVVCCGNSVCELSETYESCTRDCPNCDDTNDCTTDSYDHHKQECVNEAIIPCCGNEICDEGVETYSSCSLDCPNCDDNNKMTGDSFNYAAQKCEYLTYYFFEDFEEGDIWTKDPKSYDPRWVVVDGMLTTADGVESASTGFGNRQWTDYTLRLKIKLEQGVANVYVRAGHGEGAYGYGVAISENSLNLWKDIDDGKTLEMVGVTLGLNQFHDVEIAVKGSNIKVYFNGNLEIDYTDTDNPLLDGFGRLGAQSPGIYFDDVIIEESQ